MNRPSISHTHLSLGLLACVISSCSDSITDPRPNATILGSWRTVAIDSIDLMDDTGAIHGRTQLTSTTSMRLDDGGTLTTTTHWAYSPRIARAKDTVFTYVGTWKLSGDTLFRDAWPGALGSEDTSRTSITGNALTLTRIRTGYTVSYERIE